MSSGRNRGCSAQSIEGGVWNDAASVAAVCDGGAETKRMYWTVNDTQWRGYLTQTIWREHPLIDARYRDDGRKLPLWMLLVISGVP